jgi:hypothetical protein
VIYIYLDDLRPCPKHFVLARNAEECILMLKECEVGILSLDYDLGRDAPTGLDVARFIAAERRYPPVIFLHTSSLSGRQRMYETLYQNKPEHVRIYNHAMPHDWMVQAASGQFAVEMPGNSG